MQGEMERSGGVISADSVWLVCVMAILVHESLDMNTEQLSFIPPYAPSLHSSIDNAMCES